MLVRSARFALLAVLVLAAPAFALARAPSEAAVAEEDACTTDLPADFFLAPELWNLGGDEDTHACVGMIQPGAWMRSPAWCTMNWVFSDPAGNLYIGSAGHCVGAVGGRVALEGVGAMGTVAYRLSAGAGRDFGLVRIDADKHQLVDPTLCHWGGPTRIYAGATDDALLHYGWGADFYYQSQATRARVADLTTVRADRVDYAGFTNGGDSGSPVMSADGTALAVHTHRANTPVGPPVGYGDKYGSRLDVAVARASTALGVPLSLVAGTDAPSLVGTLPAP